VLKAFDNSLVAPVAAASVKPFQMYEMIEAFVPAGPYLELFGRVHNRRRGWITAGDEAISYKKKAVANIAHLDTKIDKKNVIEEISNDQIKKRDLKLNQKPNLLEFMMKQEAISKTVQ
jgi:hypothetical protein